MNARLQCRVKQHDGYLASALNLHSWPVTFLCREDKRWVLIVVLALQSQHKDSNDRSIRSLDGRLIHKKTRATCPENALPELCGGRKPRGTS